VVARISGTIDASSTIRALNAIEAKVNAITSTAVKQAGLVVERSAKMKLSENGRHRKGTPTPSSPGSPPSIVTSALRASVRTDYPRKLGFGSYEVMIGPTMVYARVQELGGGPKNLPARPYMAPAFKDAENDVRDVFKNAWKKVLS